MKSLLNRHPANLAFAFASNPGPGNERHRKAHLPSHSMTLLSMCTRKRLAVAVSDGSLTWTIADSNLRCSTPRTSTR